MSQKTLCIVAGQRSGTTAFRSLLSATNRFADTGEIFDTATIDQLGSFFNYCREKNLRFTDIMSGPATERLCHAYLTTLRELAGNKHLLIDIKFNSWGNIRLPWSYLHQEPFLLAHLKYQHTRFAFIWRRDIAAQVMSDRISSRLGKWHNIEASDANQPFRLDVEEIRERTKLLCLSEQYFLDKLRQYPFTLYFCYEQLFDAENLLSKHVGAKISRAFNEEFTFPSTALYRKNTIEKQSLVTNYAEITSAIEEVAVKWRTPFLAEISGVI
jgi:hypothetical protein